MFLLRKGTWAKAPRGVPMFDGKKDNPQPRPVVVVDGYGGFTRFLGRSTKPNDNPATKLNHPPHQKRCDQDACWILEKGYVSLRRSDVWTPLTSEVDLSEACFEPDEDWLDEFFRKTSSL